MMKRLASAGVRGGLGAIRPAVPTASAVCAQTQGAAAMGEALTTDFAADASRQLRFGPKKKGGQKGGRKAAPAKKKRVDFNRGERAHLNVSTIGHVDHGKTTLTAALASISAEDYGAEEYAMDDIDKTKEEQERGITIHATTVEYLTKSRHYAHVDCPGHHDFIKNMITGNATIDGAILLVAADEGPMPQTKEHLLLASQIGVKHMIVFLNKCDNEEDEDTLELIEEEVKEMLEKYGYDPEKIPFVRGSALQAINGSEMWKENIRELMRVMDETFPETTHDLTLPFCLPVDSVLDITGKGTVLTGKVLQGQVKMGDMVTVIGYNERLPKFRVDGIESFQKTLQSCEAGDNVGILLKGAAQQKKFLRRGQHVVAPNTQFAYTRFRAQIMSLSKEEGGRAKPFYRGYCPQFFFRTADVVGSFEFPEYLKMDPKEIKEAEEENKKMVMPGDHAELIITLKKPMALTTGAKFAVREGSHTIGAGIVLSIDESSRAD